MAFVDNHISSHPAQPANNHDDVVGQPSPSQNEAIPKTAHNEGMRREESDPDDKSGSDSDNDSESGSRSVKEGDGDDCCSGDDNASDFHGGYDDTPLPNVPQGYTLRFIFHSATDLPIADFHTGLADPYIIATFNRGVPKRHKGDPDLKHRTPTILRSLEPVWDSEWIVANVPRTGFSLKCRLYDEDVHDYPDRLGNVTIEVDRVSEDWEGFSRKWFQAKRRVMSKRAFLLKGLSNALHGGHITPKLCVSIENLGKSNPPFGQMCTLGPTFWIKHFSPMLGRLIGIKVNEDEMNDEMGAHDGIQKYDFQANQIQLRGPVPSKLYHRYYEFRPIIGPIFASKGFRGTIMNKALHKQHRRIYSFNPSTERGQFRACSEEASINFLKMAHFDEGGRIFTYILTLDGLLRFTETGKEFGIDMLSKHTLHSDASKYIAYSGEFFIRRLQYPDSNSDPEPKQKTHPSDDVPGGPPSHPPPPHPSYYQLYIDNESGTYRPDKSLLPDLKEFLQNNFPGLGIVTMAVGEDLLQEYKEQQRSFKKKEGKIMHVVMNKSSSSSLSSIESELDARDQTWELGRKTRKEALYAAMTRPDMEHIKEAVEGVILPHRKKGESR